MTSKNQHRFETKVTKRNTYASATINRNPAEYQVKIKKIIKRR
jgi:hypothetical protein